MASSSSASDLARLERRQGKIIESTNAMMRRLSEIGPAGDGSSSGSDKQGEIHLIVQYFLHSDRKRQQEIDQCLRINLKNREIDKVHVLLEGSTDLKGKDFDLEKANVVNFGARLTFGSAFRWASSSCKVGTKVVLANADIFFDDTIGVLRQVDNMDRACLCLLRWEVSPRVELFSGRRGPRPDSQDVWIFEVPFYAHGAEFCLGLPGCDNRIAYCIARAGYETMNPCYELKAYHMHEHNKDKHSTLKGHSEGRKVALRHRNDS